MKGNDHHIKRRGNMLYFQLSVPPRLRGEVGKAVIIEALGTGDIKIARTARDRRLVHWRRVFERLEAGQVLSPADLADVTQRVYEGTANALEIFSPAGPLWEQSPEYAGLQDQERSLQEQIASEDLILAAREIETTAARLDVTIAKGSTIYRTLGLAILSARLRAVQERLGVLRGAPARPLPPEAAKVPAAATGAQRPPTNGGKPFSEVTRLYILEMQRDPAAALSKRTVSQRESIFRLFAKHVRNAPITVIDGETATEFLDGVAADRKLTNKSVNEYVSALSTLFKWAKKRKYLTGENPFEGQSRKKARGTGWQPFMPEELQTLFGAKMSPTLRAVMAIGLYSGMRQGEIVQLRRDDIHTENGITYFNIAEESEGQHVKTEAGFRRVPVHSAIAGLLESLPAKGRLFPGLAANKFSGDFGDLRRRVGITRPRVVFHSFRKTFAEALRHVGVSSDDRAAILGHEQSFTSSVYASTLTVSQLKRIVEKITYPGLVLPR